MRLLSSWGILVLGVVTVQCVAGDDNVIVDAGKDTSTQQDVTTNDVVADVPQEADPCATAPTTNFYVNPTAGNDANNGAGPSCAFKTITAALIASADATKHANAVLHLAAGTYAAGETFPLKLDHGRSIVGAGASTTKIQGSSTPFNTTGTGSILDSTAPKHNVTLIAGDDIGGANSLAAATISDVTIIPDASITTPTANYIGLACVAGNGPNTGTTPPPPAANLVLQRVTIGPNFETGFAIGSSPTLQTACNASVITSTFTGSTSGILTGACGTVNPSLAWPAAVIGDGKVPDANTFTATGIGILGGGCGALQSINTNKFVSGYRGIVIISQAAQYFEILGNTFDGSTTPFMGMGINTSSSTNINKLNDNTFTNISETAAADTAVGAPTGYAIALGGGNVGQAQRNAIHDNDNGVYISGTITTFDFSNGGSQVNRNQLYCNSKTLSGKGYDLVLANTGGPVNFAGNQWDHNAPTTSVSLTTSANGTDVVTGTSGGATTTTSLGANTTACAAGRVP